MCAKDMQIEAVFFFFIQDYYFIFMCLSFPFMCAQHWLMLKRVMCCDRAILTKFNILPGCRESHKVCPLQTFGYTLKNESQLCRHWWHHRLSFSTTCGATNGNKVGIMMTCFQCSQALCPWWDSMWSAWLSIFTIDLDNLDALPQWGHDTPLGPLAAQWASLRWLGGLHQVPTWTKLSLQVLLTLRSHDCGWKKCYFERSFGIYRPPRVINEVNFQYKLFLSFFHNTKWYEIQMIYQKIFRTEYYSHFLIELSLLNTETINYKSVSSRYGGQMR